MDNQTPPSASKPKEAKDFKYTVYLINTLKQIFYYKLGVSRNNETDPEDTLVILITTDEMEMRDDDEPGKAYTLKAEDSELIGTDYAKIKFLLLRNEDLVFHVQRCYNDEKKIRIVCLVPRDDNEPESDNLN